MERTAFSLLVFRRKYLLRITKHHKFIDCYLMKLLKHTHLIISLFLMVLLLHLLLSTGVLHIYYKLKSVSV